MGLNAHDSYTYILKYRPRPVEVMLQLYSSHSSLIAHTSTAGRHSLSWTSQRNLETEILERFFLLFPFDLYAPSSQSNFIHLFLLR